MFFLLYIIYNHFNSNEFFYFERNLETEEFETIMNQQREKSINFSKNVKVDIDP